MTGIRTSVDRSARTVRYVGAKDDLIAAGVAAEGMFPAPGRQRKRARCTSADPAYFAVFIVPDGYSVTRWMYWNDELGARRERQRMAETDAEFVRRICSAFPVRESVGGSRAASPLGGIRKAGRLTVIDCTLRARHEHAGDRS